MQIRNAVPQDIPDIISLYRNSIVPLWNKIGRKYDLDFIRKSLEKSLQGVIVMDNMAAFAKFAIIPHASSGVIRCYVDMLLVDPKYQSQGLGRKMMEHIEVVARNAKANHIVLDVLVDNTALGFYESLGYRRSSIRLKKVLEK